MQIGIALPNQVRDVDAAVLPGWARLAEEAGFAIVGTTGRNAYPGVADTVALAVAAAVTSRVELLSHVMLTATWPAPLLAKELAGIDGVSGGRLTLGIGVGGRPDDFVAEGYGMRGRGARTERDLHTFHEVWSGQVTGDNPAVPAGTRRIPLLFGGFSPAALGRMARWGEGYVGGAVPPAYAAGTFDAARTAWSDAGRDGSPRVVALAYFALTDGERGRANVYDYYSSAGTDYAQLTSSTVATSPGAIAEAVTAFGDLGATDLVLIPATDDLDEVKRAADAAL
ncbi:LLM class flavin-dependent oxidoreductase [Amycolatopsis thermoflava]|uniref:LLM class flavin-dependent oxidoreductase n=1 Tax=Amycolatopsis thermoflava TaxID=84480 RepID=UPI00040928CD|nr:LLM class flavin-dependent oxidoreductase [Amycolatopsis thermoflava]